MVLVTTRCNDVISQQVAFMNLKYLNEKRVMDIRD